MKTTIPTLLLTMVAGALGLSGCASRNAVDVGSAFGFQEPSMQPIQKIVPLWKAAHGNDTKGTPCRGAAGRVMFFTAGNDVPTRLRGDGVVVIYVFDDVGTPREQAKPIHKYRFTMAAWNMYLNEDGSLGPSYNVFVPYTRRNVYQTTMSIVIRVLSKDGRLLGMTEPLPVVLPGVPRPDPMEGRNLASERPAGRTRATTLNQRFFNSDAARDLRQRGRQQGTQVSYQTQPRVTYETFVGNQRVHSQSGRPPADARIQEILSDFRQGAAVRGQESGDRGQESAPPLGRGFRLGSAPRTTVAQPTPALRRHPMDERRTGPSHPFDREPPRSLDPRPSTPYREPADPFARNSRRPVDDAAFNSRDDRGAVVTADVGRIANPSHAPEFRRQPLHPLVDGRRAWQEPQDAAPRRHPFDREPSRDRPSADPFAQNYDRDATQTGAPRQNESHPTAQPRHPLGDNRGVWRGE